MPLHKLLILALDSAVVYRNEQFIGEALKTLLPKHNLQRKDVFITTKLSEFSILFFPLAFKWQKVKISRPNMFLEGRNRQ